MTINWKPKIQNELIISFIFRSEINESLKKYAADERFLPYLTYVNYLRNANNINHFIQSFDNISQK